MKPINQFHEVLQTKKPIIAMAHLLPLPGSPEYDHDKGIAGIREAVLRDLEALQEGGVDAVMFGNEGDRPYLLKASPESLAAMSVLVGQLSRELDLPFGVNYLWDPVASVAVAHATGAAFVREIFTGVFDSDMGLWQPDAAAALRLRAHLRDPVLLFFNVNAEFAAPVGRRTTAARGESAVFSSLADAICVSGPMTGQSAETSDLRETKEVLPEVPVIANTGVNLDNVEEILEVADGVIIGTSLKVDGVTWNPVDARRVRRFMGRVREIRSE